MNRSAHRTQRPLSRHPAFVPLVSIWFAALCGGCLAVLPPWQRALLADSAGLTPFSLTIGAALTGTLLDWLVASLITAMQRVKGRTYSSAPAVYVEQLLEALEDSASPAMILDPPRDSAPAPRRGRAVLLLRSRAPQQLSMPLLIERFAVALDEHRRLAGREAVNKQDAPLPAEVAFEVYALRSQLNRARAARADSNAIPAQSRPASE